MKKLLLLLLFIPLMSFNAVAQDSPNGVPIAELDEVPVYPRCKGDSNAEKRKCMSAKIAKFVRQKFNTDLAVNLGLTGRQRINVIFKIDTNGNVFGIRSKGPHPRLEQEAVRVINLLPKMKPGRQKGKAVIVPYSLPITFKVKDGPPAFNADERKYFSDGLQKAKEYNHIAAVELYTKSIKNDRYFALAYNARGVSKLHLKDYRGALIDFNKAIIIQPEYGEAYFNRGLSKAYLSDNVAACTDAKQAEKLGYDSKKLISAVCIETKP